MRAGRELDCAFVSKASFLSNSRSRVLPTDSMMPMDETECSETPLLEAGSVQSLQRVFQPAMDKLCNISNVLMLCLCNFATMLCIYPLTYPLTPLFIGNALWQQSKTLLLVIDVKRFWESGGNVFLIGHKNWTPSALSPSSLSASASPSSPLLSSSTSLLGSNFQGLIAMCFYVPSWNKKWMIGIFCASLYLSHPRSPFSTSNILGILWYILTTILANSVVLRNAPE